MLFASAKGLLSVYCRHKAGDGVLSPRDKFSYHTWPIDAASGRPWNPMHGMAKLQEMHFHPVGQVVERVKTREGFPVLVF